MTPDVNVLVAAHREEHPHHDVARSWVESAVGEASRARPLTLLPTVVVGFVRVVTSARVLTPPTPTPRALAIVGLLLAQPHVRLAAQGDEWPRLVELCTRLPLAGAVVTDAWIAASVLQQHEHLVTFDRGFRRLLPARALTVLLPP